MTSQHLIENGYHEWKTGNFQKCVYNEDGEKRYFINITRTTFNRWFFWTPSMQCSLPNGRSVNIEAIQWYNTDFLNQESLQSGDIKEVEDFFEETFTKLGFGNYTF